MQVHVKKIVTLILSMSLSAGLFSATKEAAPPNEQKKDKLESFENFVCKGEIKNATKIKDLLKGLSKEQIAKFDENHKGFIRAYKLVTKNGHFKMQTDWKIEDAIWTADLLDGFIETFMKVLGVNKKDLVECEIHLYRDPEEFRRIVASMGLGMGIGGWFRSDQRMIIGFWNPDPMFHHETILIHESTHLTNFLLRRKWNNAMEMPTWLNEGMAVFFESSYMPWKRKTEIGRNSFSRLIFLKNTINNPDLAEDKKWTDIKTLLNCAGMIPGQCYGESWAMVHYLCYRYGESKKKPFTEFRLFWEKVCQGKRNGFYDDFAKFIKERSNQTPAEFLKDVIAYAKELDLPVTYMADGKTLLEWELAFPDNYVAKEGSPKDPWFIKMKDAKITKALEEGNTASASNAPGGNSSASADKETSGEELPAECKDFFVAGMDDKLGMVELENKAGTVSFDGDYLQLDVSEGVVPSEVRLKIADTEDAELEFKIRIDKGSSGIRFSGKKGDYESGYYLAVGNGGIILTDLSNLKTALAEAKDENAKKDANRKFIQFASAPLKLGQEYQFTVKLQNKTVTVSGEKGNVLAKFDAKEMKPGIVSIHIPASSKMRFTDLKAKKP